jgi:hypothetical protein
LNVVTGEDLSSVAASSHVYYWSDEVVKMFGEIGVPLSDSYELYLEFDEDNLSCGYYIADHSKRCIFWLEPVFTEDVGMNPAFSMEHSREYPTSPAALEIAARLMPYPSCQVTDWKRCIGHMSSFIHPTPGSPWTASWIIC